MLRTIVGSLCLFLLVAGVCAEDEVLPFPEGRSTQQLEGLTVEVGLPKGLSKAKPASLVVVLHGAGGSATGMAAALREWIPEGYVVCAPKSSGQVWSDSDVGRVKKIMQHLLKVLPIDAAKVHVVGFSNGGWSLPPLAFDDDLKPCTATWVASGFRGSSTPKWAVAQGVLAMAGTKDANASSALDTVKLLYGKVAAVEARFQSNLGHEWPRKLMPYFRWWMGVREGRFTPGVDLNFAWLDSLETAVATERDKKKGGIFIYAFDPSATTDVFAKALQRDIFMDPLVRYYGEQVCAVKLDGTAHRDALAALGVKSLPAVVFLKKDGRVKKVLEGKKGLKLRKVTSGFRSIAPNPKKPAGL
jgi:predicted esterase